MICRIKTKIVNCHYIGTKTVIVFLWGVVILISYDGTVYAILDIMTKLIQTVYKKFFCRNTTRGWKSVYVSELEAFESYLYESIK